MSRPAEVGGAIHAPRSQMPGPDKFRSLLCHAARRLVAFTRSLTMIIVTVALAVGILLALQAKRPFDLTRFAEPVPESGQKNDLIARYALPIASYGGPIVIGLRHAAQPSGGTLRVETAIGDFAATAFLPTGAGGEKLLLLYPGAFSKGGRLNIFFDSPTPQGDSNPILGAQLSFPKAGSWLIPDPWLWTSLVLFGAILGAAATVLWAESKSARANYYTIIVLQIFVIYILGLEFAARLAALLPAALLLLIAAVAFRTFFPERGLAEQP